MMNNLGNLFNPLLLKMLKDGNPKQIAMNMLSGKTQGNPMLENAMNMINSGDMNGIENMCKNILRSKGYDPDQIYKELQNQFR